MRQRVFGKWLLRIRRSKLSRLMAASIIFFNLVFLGIVVLLAYRTFSAVTFNEISKSRLALLNESTKRGFDFMANVSGTAYSIAANKTVIEHLETEPVTKYLMISRKREITEILQHTVVLNEGVSSIEIYSDLFNDVQQSSTDLVFPVDTIAGEGWFDKLKQADALWVPLGGSGNEPYLIGHIQHLFGSEGKTIGYLYIRLTADDVLKQFKDIPAVLDGQIHLVDTSGNLLLLVNGGSAVPQKAVLEPEWLNQHTYEGNDGYELLKKDGRTYLVMFSRPSTISWRLVQVIPTKVLLQEVRKADRQIILIGLLSLLLSALLAYFFIHNMIRPVRRLIQEMRKLERGDFRASMSESLTEEYSQMSYGFNHMVNRLQELMQSEREASAAKREAQVGLLEAQIKPHFLYNTLDMIHWKAMDYNAQDISFMITQLGKMLRIGLSGGKMMIRLRDELEHARCYVSIQQERLPFSIEYTEAIADPAVRSYYIPKVILQPLIENAIIHGYHGQDSGPLILRLEIREIKLQGSPPFLQICLLDNGQGLPEGWSMEQVNGIGTRNVMSRIQLYCGEPYGLYLANRPEKGVAAMITLPVIETEAQLERLLRDL
ncbi:sensor histidine kinase [Paenibacillus typhae]|uniref:HAMP domain-containing protein n=1 Tax=Paenibacillus typhae TaxID=1174501 RepID=A0A1G8GSF5_9BACL|nr:sensor histidine kinase [Paenibacillus typhae]SDH97345.1 HAMP domain-containing protein [Paenibacillus typhae]